MPTFYYNIKSEILPTTHNNISKISC